MIEFFENLERNLLSEQECISQYRHCSNFVDELFSTPTILIKYLKDVVLFNYYSEKSHSNPFLKKLCIYSSGVGLEVRLNYYSEIVESYHDHRWNFFSYIIKGGYIHEVFEIDNKKHKLSPIIVHTHDERNKLLLSRKYFHNITPEIGTISLLIKFPSTTSYWTKVTKNDTRIIDTFISKRKHNILTTSEKHQLVEELEHLISCQS